MLKINYYLTADVVIITAGIFMFFLWPLEDIPRPANHNCLATGEAGGQLVPLQLDKSSIYGVALSYGGIIATMPFR